MKDKPKYADLVVEGVIALNPDNPRRDRLALQRAVDSGGDSITIKIKGEKANNIMYMVGTESIRALLEMDLKEDGEK